MYEGSTIGDNETPSLYSAQSGGELIAFVKDPEQVTTINTCRTVREKNTFETAPFAIGRARPAPTVNVQPRRDDVVRRESDEEYANRMIATGTYRSPLIEVASHPVLKGLFLKNLQDRDRRLYDVLLVLLCDVQILNQNQPLLDRYISEAATSPAVAGLSFPSPITPSQQAAFVLINDRSNQDVMTIMEFVNVDYEEALQQYIDSNMSLEEWSARF